MKHLYNKRKTKLIRERWGEVDLNPGPSKHNEKRTPKQMLLPLCYDSLFWSNFNIISQDKIITFNFCVFLLDNLTI